jgi:hypothetical protein
MFVTNSYNSPYRTIQRGGRMLNNGPILIDWGLLFNLSLFTIFVCSLFYICLYRYRNKERIKKETELKKKKLIYEYKQALEENQKNQAVKRYNQILENKRYNQMMVNANLDNLRLQMTNPYLLNDNYTSQSNIPQNSSYSSNIPSFQQNEQSYVNGFNSSSNAILNDNLNTFYDNNPKQKEHNSQNTKYDPDIILDKVGGDSKNLKDSDMYFAAYDNFDFNNSSYASANFDTDSNQMIIKNEKTNKNNKNNQNIKNSENNKGYDMLRKSYKVDDYKPISYSTEFNKFL